MELCPLSEAIDRINQLSPIGRPIEVALSNAGSGVVLAEDVFARHAVPPFANSAVDGFALGECPEAGAEVPITTRLTAGSVTGAVLNPGEAAEIFTGAPLPNGTVTVIMHEDTARQETGIRLMTSPKPGDNMRDAGEDYHEGGLVARAGCRPGAAQLAALALTGHDRVKVCDRLRIGVFSGGNELTEPGQTLRPGRIHDGNRPGLLNMIRHNHHEVHDLGILPDRLDAGLALIEAEASKFDVLIGSSGMSHSSEDITAQSMERLGEVLFWQLAIKPARPIGLARWQRDDKSCVLLGLPGNPASCLIAMWLVGFGVLDRLQGGRAALPQGMRLTSGFALRKKPHRREFVRARLEPDGETVTRIEPSGSAHLSTLIAADGLVDLPRGMERLEVGDQVWFRPFPDFVRSLGSFPTASTGSV